MIAFGYRLFAFGNEYMNEYRIIFTKLHTILSLADELTATKLLNSTFNFLQHSRQVANEFYPFVSDSFYITTLDITLTEGKG